MSSPRYNLVVDSFEEEEIQTAIEVLRSGRYTMGLRVGEFEKALADWLGIKHAVMVNSGSSANLLLVESLLRRMAPKKAPLKPGDEILVPALAWSTTVWPLVQLGLIPVFVDVEPSSLALSLESAEKTLSPKTRGLFLVHVLGYGCDMKQYVEFCQAYDLVLFEDCCESFGAFDQGQHIGTFGYGGTLSHFFSHQLTTIEGGTVFVNDDDLAEDLRSMRAHGWIRDRQDRDDLKDYHKELDPRFLFVLPGYNVRPTEIQAAIGLIQLRKMDDFLDQRSKVAWQVIEFNQRFTPWMRVIGKEHASRSPVERERRRHSWMNIPFVLAEDAPVHVNVVKKILEECDVETRPIIAGNLTRHPAMKLVHYRTAKPLQVADDILNNGFVLGCHHSSSEKDLEILERGFETLSNLS